MSFLNTVAPIKEIELKQRTEPWAVSDLLDLMKVRGKYLYQIKNINIQKIISYFVLLEIRFKGI